MDVFNAFKGIEDDIAEAVEGVMPRQAVVTRRGEPSGVWVRFTPVDANAPEAWFPSTVAGLPVGTSGWVHPLAGGKGRFIADNVPLYTQAQVDALIAAYQPSVHVLANPTAPFATATTAGTYLATTAAQAVTGLNPGREYTVSGTVEIHTGFETTLRVFMPMLRAAGLTTVDALGMNSLADRSQDVVMSGVFARVRPSAAGTITLTPGFSWTSGTVTGRWLRAIIEVK